MFLIKTMYQFVKESFVAPSINVIKNYNMFQKISVYPKTSYLNNFLLSTSTFLQNRYILKRKSCLHSRGIPAYLYSQLTKLLLTSRNMNYPKKNLIYLKQVYTFQSNQIKFENPKYSLPLKRFIVPLLAILNPRKPKVRKKRISRILLILIFASANLIHVYYVNIASYETLEKIKISL